MKTRHLSGIASQPKSPADVEKPNASNRGKSSWDNAREAAADIEASMHAAGIR